MLDCRIALRSSIRQLRSGPARDASPVRSMKTDTMPGAFLASMLEADFKAIRGNFSIGPDQHPIEHRSATRVTRNAQGQLAIVIEKKTVTAVGGSYAKDCQL